MKIEIKWGLKGKIRENEKKKKQHFRFKNNDHKIR